MPYFDTHCHLDFSQGDWEDLGSLDAGQAPAAQAAPEAGRTGLAAAPETQPASRFACMTCSPQDFLQARDRFAGRSGILLGCGLHPRWIADGLCGEEDVQLLCNLVESVRIVGEVGLDFLAPYAHAAEQQERALRSIMAACARMGGRVVSVHALRSASHVLDIMEETGAAQNCSCIMHWFSGSCQELQRAIRAGCWFSVNDRMLATRKGREYAKAIPADRLLLETDLPSQPGEQATAAQLHASLQKTLAALKELRRQDCAGLCYQNARDLFGPAR